MYPTAQGTGDAGTICNFGQSAFAQAVPTGYTPGWPAAAGGFTTLDATKAFGSAAIVPATGNLRASFITTAGMIQAIDGYNSGKYYFEQEPLGDFFSRDQPGGLGRNFVLGGDFNAWFNGAFTVADPLGGALVKGNSVSSQSSVAALDAIVIPDVFGRSFVGGDIVCFAVLLTTPPPPPEAATLAELWFSNTAGFVDLTSVANRRKFISVTGGAQNLGVNGELPFGTSPVVFLTNTGVPSSFALNNGRGGPFAQIGGALTHGATDPPSTSISVTMPGAVVKGQGVLGDYLTGNLYAFNTATYLDNGSKRKWVRRWRALPQASPAADRFSYLAIVMETGVGVPQNSNPQMVLRWSDDGGKTWSSGRIIPVGRSGETAFTVKVNRLGSTRRFGGSDRLFELSSTDPFRVALLDADLEVS